MKKNLLNKIKLNKEEEKLLKAFEKGEFISSGNLEKRKHEVSQAARNTLLKNKRINIRMREKDLITIKKKAEQHGLPYQTLIATLLRHYANGKINIIL